MTIPHTAVSRTSHRDWPRPEIEQFVVSFPKSGRTWLRVLLAGAEAVASGQDQAANAARWLDTDTITAGERTLSFTHGLSNQTGFGPADMQAFADHISPRRRLLLLRDPRDVVVSYFFQRTRRRTEQPPGMPRTLAEFVRHPALGIDRIIQFTNIWVDAVSRGGPIMLLAYEHLHRQPLRCLQNALTFLGMDCPAADALQRAIDFASFQNMRKMEASDDRLASRKLKPGDPADEESYKLRKGKISAYSEYLAPAEIEFIDERCRQSLHASAAYHEPGDAPALIVREAADASAAGRPLQRL
jgi:hypothetical protein